MIILCDTREQNPLEFKHEYVTEIRREKLDVGDYGAMFTDGVMPPVYFERKSIGDLYGTLGGGYPRFRKELERAKASGSLLFIIIEGSYRDILRGYPHSTIQGISIIRKLWTLYWKYGVQHIYCNSREDMANQILECYFSIGRMKKKESK